MVRITHSKVSGKPQGQDPTRIYGNHWDADHVVEGLDIGADVQAHDATLDGLSGKTSTGSGAIVLADAPTLTSVTADTVNGVAISGSGSADFGPGGTVAYTEDKLSVFAATTSAELKSVISDETGSGALVFGTSPNIAAPTGIVKGDVGLGNVDDTSDADKPVSGATQTALDAKVTGPASVTDDLPAIFDGPTGKLLKAKTYAAFKTLLALVKGDVGLGNVDNTSDATKNAATATLTNKTLTAPVINSPTGLVKADVGLGNVDNTSDATRNSATVTLTNKTISGATNTLTVREADLSTTDISTGNVSTTKHGFAPKLPNDATKYLDGTGGWSAPAGGGGAATPSPPQGRLTLTSATPVMATSVTDATIVYYTPCVGGYVPIYDGTAFTMTAFSELSQATTDTTKSPAAVANNLIYDMFVWNDGGTVRCTRGPAWTNDTTRSIGTALVMVNGILLNNASITNGPAARRGTYVGSVRSGGIATIHYIFGAPGAGGVVTWFAVWNAYNRVTVATTVTDTTSPWAYPTATVRPSNNSTSNRVSFLSGLPVEGVSASYAQATQLTANAGSVSQFGLALDNTTAFDKRAVFQNPASSVLNGSSIVATTYAPQLGWHFIQALEKGDGAHSNLFGTTDVNGLNVQLVM